MADERLLCSDRRVYLLESGRKMTFINVHKEGDGTRGYSSKLRKWAWLYSNGIHIDGQIPVSAKVISG